MAEIFITRVKNTMFKLEEATKWLWTKKKKLLKHILKIYFNIIIYK